MKPNLKVALAQIKIISGDLQGNSDRIVDGINRAINTGSDLVVFPELAITGYNCGMMFNQHHFIENNLQFLHKVIAPTVPQNLIAIVGFVDLIGNHFDGTPNIQNSVAVIQNGRIIATSAKVLLANGGHHDDRHYFTAGEHPKVVKCVTADGFQLNIGLAICEDTWSQDHSRDIVRELKQDGAEIIVAVNQSYFYYGKQEKRRKMYQKHNLNNRIPIVSVNNVGVGDIGKDFMIYDGGSMIIGDGGDTLEMCLRFSPDFKVVDLHKKTYERRPSIGKYEEIYNALVFSVKHIFYDLGLKKGQVHISGGVDSSVVLPIVVEALGKENVIAISNPSHFNGNVTKTNAQELCDALDVKLYWNSIEDIQQAFVKSHQAAFGTDSVKPLVLSTFDAVGRTVQGLAASHTFGSGIIATGNHTELVLGWANFHDIGSIGVMSLIGDLTKIEVFELAKYINKRFQKEIIPVNLFDGKTKPAAELADANEDPWNYYVVSGICAELIREFKDVLQICEEYKSKKLNKDFFPVDPYGKDVYQLVNYEEFEAMVKLCFQRSKISVFKTAQSAPIVLISPISRGFSSRETIINKYAGTYVFQPVKYNVETT